MENKINIAELLKDCPQGMELDCVLYDDVAFECVSDDNCYPIKIHTPEHNMLLSKYGCLSLGTHAKCVIFPKGRTTWEGFVPPCKFKDGDVVVAEGEPCQLFLLKHVKYREDNNGYDGYCYFGWDFLDNRLFEEGNWGFNRLATEEEKAKLFDTIKANGYKWNAETKTLEKIVPKFKVGDRIVHKVNKESPFTITEITNDCYKGGTQYAILIEQQDNFELVPNKFDISTLKPFDKVLTRANDADSWVCNLYSHCIKDYYVLLNAELALQCIPYEGNEHLLGKTDDCSEFYKTWE